MVQDRRGIPVHAAANSLLSPQGRISSKHDLNVTLAAASSAAALAVGYPIGFNESTEQHAPWMAPDPTVAEVFLGSTPATGGTWGFKINDSSVEVDVPFDDTAAEVAAIFKAEGYDVTVVLANDTYTITFDGEPEIKILPTVVLTESFTGETASTVTVTAGTSTFGTHNIKGFINPEVTQIGTEAGTAALVVLTGTDTVCTGTTVNAHNLVTGMSITVSGATEAKLNITATITVLSFTTFTYTVAAVSGGTVDSGAYTTTNDTMAIMMVKGQIHASLPESLVASGDVTALRTALKNSLIADGLIVQGLAGRF